MRSMQFFIGLCRAERICGGHLRSTLELLYRLGGDFCMRATALALSGATGDAAQDIEQFVDGFAVQSTISGVTIVRATCPCSTW